MPRLSIGLPVYNGSRYLSGAIESLLGQSFADFELIISDNASTDATEAICRDYAAKDARVRYVRQRENLGAAGNFNRVFELARAELFSWAAADDLRQETYYEQCIQLLDQRPEVLWCHSLSSHIGPEGEILPQTALQGVSYVAGGNTPARDADRPARRLAGVLLGAGGCLDSYGVIRSAALRETSMILPYFGSEKVLIAELALAGRYAEVPQELFRMRIHAAAVGATQTGEGQQAVFAPHTAPHWIRLKLLAAYFRAIARAALKPRERMRCYLVLLQYLLQIKKWPELLRKAMRGCGIGGDNAKILKSANVPVGKELKLKTRSPRSR